MIVVTIQQAGKGVKDAGENNSSTNKDTGGGSGAGSGKGGAPVAWRCAPIVTDEDLKETERRIEGLKWDIATTTHSLRKKRNAKNNTASSAR